MAVDPHTLYHTFFVCHRNVLYKAYLDLARFCLKHLLKKTLVGNWQWL